MSVLYKFDDTNFRQAVLENDTPVLVDFTASWCAPCKRLAPIIEQLNQEWAGKVKVGHLDIDANPETPLAYGIMGVPTLILFKGGQPVERLTGFVGRERILDKLAPHL